jgi:ssDNA-binding Zn-finger/Zn-ribbon topoisomerase 1
VNQKQFYKTMAWRRARDAYIQERMAVDGGLCEACHAEPGKIVHHFKVWLDDVNCNDLNISLNPANFMLECQTCHNKEVDPRKETPGRCKYGQNGEIIRNTDW